MENIRFALNAILPILLVMAAGALARRFTSFDKEFFKRLNALSFRFFLSVNVFCNIYNVEDIRSLNWGVLAFILAGLFLCMFIGLLGAALTTKDLFKRGPIIQAAFRSNNAIIGVSLAAALATTNVTETVAFASLSSGLVTPLINIAAVIVLTVCSAGKDASRQSLPSFGQWCKKILTNPLVLGATLGFVCLLVRSLLPTVGGVPVFTFRRYLPAVYEALSTLSKAASPVMLFCLGATLDFASVKLMWREIGVGIFLRIVLCPVIVIGLALLLREPLGITRVEIPGLIAVFASPVAVSSAVTTQECGGNTDLANHLVVWSSVLSMGTLFLFILFLRGIGML